MANSFDKRNAAYQKFRAQNPGVSFAQYNAKITLAEIAEGKALAQLGPKLSKHENWWEAGRSAFESYVRRFSIDHANRVLDYGCGTLRVGGHFIQYLDRGCYFGLDVDAALLDVGVSLIGNKLIAEKSPRFGVIFDEADFTDAQEFGADFVYSSSVCYHVHPDEAPTYFGNLQRLTHKPDAVLFFSSAVNDKPAVSINLVKPVPYYIEMLSELQFVKFHKGGQHALEREVSLGLFEFRRSR